MIRKNQNDKTQTEIHAKTDTTPKSHAAPSGKHFRKVLPYFVLLSHYNLNT